MTSPVTRTVSRLLLPAIFTLAVGCSRQQQSPSGAAALDPASASDEELGRAVGYPSGPWWRSPKELEPVRLAASHIVISHASVPPGVTEFGVVIAPTKRTRAEALRVASILAQQLAKDPSAFERVAAKESDERVSAALSGFVGVFPALEAPPKVIDALGALAPGAVSHVVETDAGFEIVRREPVPAAERVSVARIAVAHSGSPLSLGRKKSERTHREAFLLAHRIAADLLGNPDGFADAARKYSDADDGFRGGDVGSWSTHEGGAPSLPLEVCRRLPPGGISGVVETEAGFEIMRRLPERPRRSWALTDLFVAFDDTKLGSGESAPSRDEAALAADRMVAALSAGSTFDDVAARFCPAPACTRAPRTGIEGRGLTVLEKAALEMPVGAVAPHRLESAFGFHVVRREPDVADPAPAPFRFELPSPPAPTVEDLVSTSPAEPLAAVTRELGTTVGSRLGGPEGKTVEEAFSRLAARFADSPVGERATHLRGVKAEIREKLGDAMARRIEDMTQAALRARAQRLSAIAGEPRP